MLKLITRNSGVTRVFVGLALTLACLLLHQTGFAQEPTEKPDKLFSSEGTMKVTLTAPWRNIQRDKQNQEGYPGKIQYVDAQGNPVSLDLMFERRGITRQRVCEFPPIRLRFDKEAVKGTVFRGQDSLKMVTHCERASRIEQYYILEMLAYKAYNLITDYSFRVRTLNVTYVDSDTGKVDEGRFAFLIEDDSDVAKRHDLKKLKVPNIRVSQLEPAVTSRFSLFQFMIANVDWAALDGPDPDACCHNVKLIGPDPFTANDKAYPIPYDFDSSGLVNAHYAMPPQGVPIRSVTQRLYRGYCADNSTLEAARQTFLQQEDSIYQLFEDEKRLFSNSQKKALKYLGKFFEIIKDPDDFEKEVIRKCRK